MSLKKKILSALILKWCPMSLFFSKWSPSSLPAVQGCSWSDLNPSLRTNHLHLTTWNSQQTYQAFHPCLFTRLHLGAVPLLRIFPRKLLLLSFMTQRQDSNVGRMIMRGEEREVEIALGKFLLICPVRFYFSVLCVPTTVFITFIQHSVFMYAFAWIFFSPHREHLFNYVATQDLPHSSYVWRILCFMNPHMLSQKGHTLPASLAAKAQHLTWTTNHTLTQKLVLQSSEHQKEWILAKVACTYSSLRGTVVEGLTRVSEVPHQQCHQFKLCVCANGGPLVSPID